MPPNELDIVKDMLANEKKPATNKKKNISVTAPKKKLKKTVKQPAKEIKYIDEDAWEEMGQPNIYEGFSTNRLHQWKYKTKAYYEVLLELYRAAILYSELIKRINWHKETNDERLELCRKEIKRWRQQQGISHHELSVVVDVAYQFYYSRKKLIKETKRIAEIVLQNRKDDKLKLKDVADIPARRSIELRYVNPVQISDEVMSGIAGITGNTKLTNPQSCSEHENYRGLRRPRNNCEQCLALYNYNKAIGIKETRTRD